MANIVIKELDLTTPSVTGSNNEVVYVPGFATNDKGAFADFENRAAQFAPTLCSTLDEFNYYFGSYPAVFTEDLPWGNTSFSDAAKATGNMFSVGDVDPSYMYAKELINAGITVLYEKMNDESDSYSPASMYTALKGEVVIDAETNTLYDPYVNISDVGEYSVKYITSGGYPTFESGVALNSNGVLLINGEDDGVDDHKVTIDDSFYQTFTRELGEYKVLYRSNAEAQHTIQQPPVVSNENLAVTVSNQFLSGEGLNLATSPAEQTYVFTATVSGEPATTTWACSNAATITGITDISAYGITIESGTVANSDTISITVVTTGGSGWYIEAYNDVVDPYTYIGNLEKNSDDIFEIVQGSGSDMIVSGILIGNAQTQSLSPTDGWVIDIYITSNVETNLAAKLIACAASRGDALALIDHTNNRNRPLTGEKSVYYAVSNAQSNYRISANNEYGTMFTPWFVYTPILGYASSNRKYNKVKSWVPSAMPGSFAYLMSLALSVRDNPSWLAIAGVTRGVVPYLSDLAISRRLTNAIADSYQPDTAIAINPITNIRPYGYTIWGNRTLKDNAKKGGLTATSFLNIRNMLSDIKKQAYNAAVIGLFEQNNEILWLNFKSYIEPLLDQMTSGYGISDYSIVREPSDSPAKVVATIRIYPVYAVEMFEITVELSNSTLEVTE